MGLSCSGVHILHIYHNCQKPKFHDVSHGHGNALCDLVSYVQKPSGWLLVTMINWGSKGDLLSV